MPCLLIIIYIYNLDFHYAYWYLASILLWSPLFNFLIHYEPVDRIILLHLYTSVLHAFPLNNVSLWFIKSSWYVLEIYNLFEVPISCIFIFPSEKGKVRWLITCSSHGFYTDSSLQFWWGNTSHHWISDACSHRKHSLVG